MKRTRFHSRGLRGRIVAILPVMRRHLAETAILAIIGIALIWLIFTRTLPYALAEAEPELALKLDPDQPLALLTLAERAREKLLASSRTSAYEGRGRTSVAETDAPSNDSLEAAVSLASKSKSDAEERIALRDQIRSLTRQSIARDPLNPTALRMLAEATEDQAQVAMLMREAFRQSRRESQAVLWLLNDSFERKDFADAVEKADVLLRTSKDLAPVAIRYLGNVAGTEGRQALVSLLAKEPPWRGAFFDQIADNVQQAGTPFELMLALKDAGSPPSTKEIAPYLKFLMQKNLVELAYNTWLQFVPQERLLSLGLLNNSNFARDPSGLPFDWSIERGRNAVAELVSLADEKDGRALRFTFSAGRVLLPQTSQILMLPPGKYRLNGEFRSAVSAERGLRWAFYCWRGKSPIAKTQMLYGHSPGGWQGFALETEIPNREDCRAQELRLFHDARSASEELISGEITFRKLHVVWLE